MSKLEEYRALKKELSDKIMELVFEEAKSLVFDPYPEVNSIAFFMYTPSFNDGEPCENTMGEVYYYNLNDYGLEEYSVSQLVDDSEEELSQYEIETDGKFARFLYDNEDLLLDGLGTNVSVVITRSGNHAKDEYYCGY